MNNKRRWVITALIALAVAAVVAIGVILNYSVDRILKATDGVEEAAEEQTVEEETTEVQPFEETVDLTLPAAGENMTSAEIPEEVMAEEAVPSEQLEQESVQAEQPAEEAVSAEQPAEKSVSAEQPAEEAVSAEQPAEESVPSEQLVMESAQTEQPTEEAVSTEQTEGKMIFQMDDTQQEPAVQEEADSVEGSESGQDKSDEKMLIVQDEEPQTAEPAQGEEAHTDIEPAEKDTDTEEAGEKDTEAEEDGKEKDKDGENGEEEKEEKEEEEKEEEEEEAEGEAELQARAPDGARIIVKKLNGTFPDGAYVKVLLAAPDTAQSAVEGAMDQREEIVDMVAYDITIYDREGKEIGPDDDTQVTILGASLKDGESASVYRIEDNGEAKKITDVDDASETSFPASGS